MMDGLFIQLIIAGIVILLGSLILIYVNRKLYGGAMKDKGLEEKGRDQDV